MEPGLRDRENVHRPARLRRAREAAMEPGLRDRENHPAPAGDPVEHEAAMEPGLRDRENAAPVPRCAACRNGARRERPGKPLSFPRALTTGTGAAMEPGLRDRENGKTCGLMA